MYVSDAPGNHDFDLLRRVVLPDGSVLRGKLPARPTRDCLFASPLHDGKTVLKVGELAAAACCMLATQALYGTAASCTVPGMQLHADCRGWAQVALIYGSCIAYSHIESSHYNLPSCQTGPATV